MATTRRRSFMDSPVMGGDQPIDVPARPRDACMAHGCPVLAGLDASNGDRVCRFHHGEPGGIWQEITRRLRVHGWLVNLINWLYSGDGPDGMPGWEAKAHELVRRHKFDEAQRRDGETAKLYAHRLNALLAREVFTGLDRRRPPKADPAAPQRAADHLPPLS